MDNWLYKMAAPVFIDGDGLKWDSIEPIDFIVRIYINRIKIKTQEKRIPAKFILYYNIKQKYGWDSISSEVDEQVGPYDILKYRFTNKVPNDIKKMFEAISGYKSFNWINSIHLGTNP